MFSFEGFLWTEKAIGCQTNEAKPSRKISELHVHVILSQD